MRINIDWNAIRPLNGSKAKGFEELCTQLARCEGPDGSRFERKGTPDAGVECYVILSDGNEWGWQAKYFNEFGNSQWSQIDASIKTALEKHPKLVRYFVCVPLDRPDARIDGQMSARDRWEAHVKTWTGWASSLNIKVDFIYWGSSELLELLVKPQHIGRVRFWFDIHGFDKTWFTARLDEALKTAGPRYTPEINVDLPIASELDAFGRIERFFDQIKSQALVIRKKLRDFEYSKPKPIEQTLDAEISKLSSETQAILSELGAITAQPIGILPFKRIADHVNVVEVTADNLENLLLEREREHDAKPPVIHSSTETSPQRNNPFRESRYALFALSSMLETDQEVLMHANSVASCSLMILKGKAGTGKTHLLCDIARQRISAGLPTVLLMGQKFISTDDPWTQTLRQLDLSALSVEEFIGALETAAQVAGCRALVMVDAINEGSGRLIWPSHLAAFLAHLERSPWIGVVLSIRSSYEEVLIPEEIRARAVTITHQGFTECEYDATQAFFIHYNLELPSTPLLSPEFRNPLFLKTLCNGLNTNGEHRLPRGFHGFTIIFDMYLNSINSRLASSLGFNPKFKLVQQALESITKVMAQNGDNWLTLTKADEVVNALLPGRNFEQSLFRGLVVEGVLIEEILSQKDGANQETVVIAYERLADHLITKSLLDQYLNPDSPASAFMAGAPLAFIWDKSRFITPGFLEAMCIQISERTKQELVLIAPNVIDHWGIGEAFRQSIIWRDISAFSTGTLETLNKLIRSKQDSDDTVDVLLTVATLAGHPFNANFLDHRLRKDSMPERDSWWSVYLHHAWGTHSTVDRLVSWASCLTPDTVVDDDVIDLCSMTLTWMLSSSNRFLRDNVTQALVNLLTGRLNAVIRLIQKFADINDAYIAERMYAITYGTAMRSHQTEQVGALAKCVYDIVFASAKPPAHILLRDYARGVVERAIYLGAKIDIEVERIRPPYVSQWPEIPSEDEIKPFLPDWSQGSHDSGDTEWARNRIGSSVMADDFAHYVISTNWTSLELGKPTWQSPDTRIATLIKDFSEKERSAWKIFRTADDAANELPTKRILVRIQQDPQEENISDKQKLETKETNATDPELIKAEQERDIAFNELELKLTERHFKELEPLLVEKKKVDSRRPPRFDIHLIQRYILKRVFDLGWTTERFGEFDRFSIDYKGREASKAERIGKKYQWIAYHEIMALVADHFQYEEEFNEESDNRVYGGPWQDHFRDIDPSCTLRGSSENSLWDAHSPAWWCPAHYEHWGEPDDARSWLLRYDDLPKIEELLSISNPNDNSKWLNAQSFLLWKQTAPPGQDRYDIERRELWYIFNGYLIHAQDQEAFIKWAKEVDFYGRWMPDPPEVYRMFLGEYGWAPAFRYFQQQYFTDVGDKGWVQPNHDCPVKIRPVAFEYLRESGCFDCSVNESYKLRLPSNEIITGLGLQWSGNGADYTDPAGQLTAFDPTAQANGPQSLLLREDSLKEFLKREKLTICWTVIGEKMTIQPGLNPNHESLRLSGAYILGEKNPVGFLKCMVDDQNGENTSSSSRLLVTFRSPDLK